MSLLFVPIIAWLIGILVSKLIARPIDKLHRGIEIIGDGNLDYKVGTDAKDEIGQLSRAFDQMTERLKGTTTSIDNLHKEIDERKKTEEALKESEYLYKETQRISKMGGWSYDVESEQSTFTDTIYEIYGEKFSTAEEGIQFYHPDDKEIVRNSFNEVITKQKPYDLEVRFINAQGDNLFVRTIGQPLIKNGKVVKIYGNLIDITERKQVEQKLKEAMEIKSQFISMASHELRTPLTAIKEGIAIVMDGSTGKINDEQEDFLGMAKRNVDRLARLINDVLDFQKLEAGGIKFNIQEKDINEVVKEVYETMVPLTKEKGLNFVVKLDENLPKARFDNDKIIQVLTNIVNNAIKFTEKGTITVTTSKQDNVVCVAVQDTGPGVKKEDIQKLFHKFEQLAKLDDRKTGGTGLGLAISKEIVEKHNGKIWAESKYGKGMTFYFTLPVMEKGK